MFYSGVQILDYSLLQVRSLLPCVWGGGTGIVRNAVARSDIAATAVAVDAASTLNGNVMTVTPFYGFAEGTPVYQAEWTHDFTNAAAGTHYVEYVYGTGLQVNSGTLTPAGIPIASVVSDGADVSTLEDLRLYV